jgi:hypothetical protein
LREEQNLLKDAMCMSSTSQSFLFPRRGSELMYSTFGCGVGDAKGEFLKKSSMRLNLRPSSR